jgi:hypothetical protein
MAEKNMYAEAQARREAEQAMIKRACGMDVDIPRVRKSSLHLTISEASKEKLLKYASYRGLSVSVVIQLLIDEHCV